MATIDACWKKAHEAFGTSKIFERRQLSLRRRLRIVSFWGLVLPLVVGGVVGTFGTGHYITPLLWVSGAAAVVQAIVSLWALNSSWEDDYAYARESSRHNARLNDQFEKLAKSGLPQPEFDRQFDLLDVEDQFRRSLDNNTGISPTEVRFGYRSTLFQYQLKCPNPQCNTVPIPDRPTKCPTCGE